MAAAWVRLCALVLIGVSSGAALAKDKTPTAIVVGGGLAGLTAAYELQNKGWQVTLLEAKSGMGGRSGLATSEWIGNAKAQPVLNQYLDRFKLETLPAPEFVRTPGYLIDGEYFSATDLATKQPATAEALKRYEKTLDDLARSIDDPLNPQATSTLFALDQINVSTWLDKLQLPATARQLVNQQIRTRYDEPSRLSLLYFAQQNRVYRGVSDRDLRAARLPGGSPVLAQAFVKQLKTIKTRLAGYRHRPGQGRGNGKSRQRRLPGRLPGHGRAAARPGQDPDDPGPGQPAPGSVEGHQLWLARPADAQVQEAGVGKPRTHVGRNLQ